LQGKLPSRVDFEPFVSISTNVNMFTRCARDENTFFTSILRADFSFPVFYNVDTPPQDSVRNYVFTFLFWAVVIINLFHFFRCC